MKALVYATLAALITSNTQAADIFKLSELTTDFGYYQEGSRDNMFWNGLQPKELLNATIKSTVFSYLDWTSVIKSQTNQYQFHTVGLEMSLGLHVTPQIELYGAHWSQHILDNHYPYAGYPWEDHVGVKFKTYFDPSAAPKSLW